MAPGTILPKDEEVLNIVERKIAAGEKVLIYTNWTRLDSQMRLQTLLTARGWNTIIMPAKVKPAKREQWVADRLSAGLQVLIANPTLVQTGLDLNAFTTLIFYDTGYKLFTLRQASRRSWRINQTAPRVEVYMFYYRDTIAAQGDQAHGLQAGCGGNYRGLVLRGGPCRHVRVRGYDHPDGQGADAWHQGQRGGCFRHVQAHGKSQTSGRRMVYFRGGPHRPG